MTLVWATPMQNHTEKLVALAIADNANDNGVCWPSVTTIARKCDLSEQGVLNRIKSLQKTGWLKVEHKPGCSNTYVINPPTPLTPQQGLPPNAVDPHPPTPLTPPPNAVDPNRKEPSFEPSKHKEPAALTAVQTPPLSPAIKEVIEAWNNLTGLSKCIKFSEDRTRKLKSRLRDPFFAANWRAALNKVQASPFCHGEGGRGWKADIDWFLKPDSCLRVMEGKYDKVAAKPTQSVQSIRKQIFDLENEIKQLEGQLVQHFDRERYPHKVERLNAAKVELEKLKALP